MLSEDEKRAVIAAIERGEPLSDDYRFRLFREPREAELIWPGKTHEVTNVVLPFQTIEQIDEPRAGSEAKAADLFDLDTASGRQAGGWTNKLIWGDNKLVLAALKNGPLRREIEAAGGLKLVYIDPPFDVGADFSFELEVGDYDRITKDPSVIEEIAYRDTWGQGTDSFLSMLTERAAIMHALLEERGLLFLHIGWAVSHLVKAALDEIFGRERFINQVIWKRQTAHSDTKQGSSHMGRIHDIILLYSKSDSYSWNMQYEPYSKEYVEAFYKHVDPNNGRRYRLSDLTGPGGASKGNPRYEFLGVTRYWRFKRERMQELYQAGRIVQSN